MRLSNTPIAIDEFRYIPSVSIYILTHLHADHTTGLSTSWNNGIIYCSEITASLLVLKFGIPSSLIRTIGLNCSTPIFLDEESTETCHLTFIDATHCPGSVMVILQGYFGTILHTGDFRFHDSVLENSLIRNLTFDMVYLDNTYCHPKFDFPSKEDVAEEILQLIVTHKDKRIVIGVDTLGKEELLVYIAESLNTKIIVSESRYKTIEAIDVPTNLFSYNPDDGFIHTILRQQLNKPYIEKLNQEFPTIGIIPSALNHPYPSIRSQLQANNLLFQLPYSLHSSFKELKKFVSSLKIRKLSPIVTRDNGNLFKYFHQFLLRDGLYCDPNKVSIPLRLSQSMTNHSKAIKKSPKQQPSRNIQPSTKKPLQYGSSDEVKPENKIQYIPSPTKYENLNQLLEAVEEDSIQLTPIQQNLRGDIKSEIKRKLPNSFCDEKVLNKSKSIRIGEETNLNSNSNPNPNPSVKNSSSKLVQKDSKLKNSSSKLVQKDISRSGSSSSSSKLICSWKSSNQCLEVFSTTSDLLYHILDDHVPFQDNSKYFCCFWNACLQRSETMDIFKQHIKQHLKRFKHQ